MTDDFRAEAQAHVSLADGRAFSLSITRLNFAGSTLVRASFTDVQRRRCATAAIGDTRVPALLRERFARERGGRHPLVRSALDEVLAADHLAYPDAIADDLGGNAIVARDGIVEMRIVVPGIAAHLTIAGRDVSGTLDLDGVSHAARGIGTYFESPDRDRAIVQLDDGTDLDIAADELVPVATWTSLYTFHEYAVAWRVADLELRAVFDDQELVTATARAPLWKGRCSVTGTLDGRAVTGVAYVEQTARDAAAALPDFFAKIPRETLRVIHHQLPLPLAFENVLAMLGTDLARYVRDVDLEELQRILIRPIREILDRKGKAWRSYTAVVCYYALRGDQWRQDVIDVLLGLAEVIHVGSLIVDDVEDASPSRRGGPACHVAHGIPLAINAGSFCYFVWQAWFARLDIPSAAKLRIYEIYFEFMRLAHLGQALDIQGFTRGMAEEIVATGDVTLLARQLNNVYLLKTGAPASVFGRIGAIVAGGEEAQVRVLGDLFEALGIAFQIMDDVQNLRGFIGDAKHAEDLAQAKITMPVIEAMRVLDLPARRDLWDRIGRCGQEPVLVPSIVATLEECGAFTACRDQAHVLLDNAWRAAAPLLEDSVAKVMLRSFCLYVVECLG
jgi:geranylgeranyl pyrophosphate synthase